MITQIEIDGFKTFKDFKVELAPFQVIVGANGSGKSNLFDALHLLSRLAEVDLRTAFQELRGDAHELFTLLPNGQHTKQIRMAVELLVNRNIQDSLGKEAELTYTRLRYEIAITQRTDERGLEQLQVINESLRLIPQSEDTWCKKYEIPALMYELPHQANRIQSFIGTFNARPAMPTLIEPLTICLYADGEGQEREYLAEKVQRTVLSTIISTNYPHSFAVRQEILSWKFLNLDPKELRKPSSINDPAFLTKDGGNLPATLARMQAEDSFAMTGVSLDMANLVPGLLNIKVDKNVARSEYDIWAETDDEITFSANVLSDGTLRLLALASIRNDAQFQGVLCLEEPENGVHPLHLKNMAYLLREMATNYNNPLPGDLPLRQILITTHSAALISQPAVIDALLLAFTVKKGGIHVTRMEPVITPQAQSQIEEVRNRERAMEVYTLDTVQQYLQRETVDEASNQLKKVRMITDIER
ncbi:MAG: AAA family ATPase [Ktedonobacteraceae bacterium]